MGLCLGKPGPTRQSLPLFFLPSALSPAIPLLFPESNTAPPPSLTRRWMPSPLLFLELRFRPLPLPSTLTASSPPHTSPIAHRSSCVELGSVLLSPSARGARSRRIGDGARRRRRIWPQARRPSPPRVTVDWAEDVELGGATRTSSTAQHRSACRSASPARSALGGGVKR